LNYFIIFAIKIQFWIVLVRVLLWLFVWFSYEKLFKRKRYFFFLLNSLLIIVRIRLFLNIRYLGFYVRFEISLILILLLILNWGYQFEKIQASFYILLYRVFFGVPFLVSIIFLIKMREFFYYYIHFYFSRFIILRLLGIFFVKCPLFFFHYWLPKAHVESISLGSIILAAILLKIGRFGIFIFSIIIKSFLNLQLITFLVFTISIGFVLRNFFILRQVDFKKIIAYFSVSHITLWGLSLFIYIKLSYSALFYLNISHAYASTLLFFYRGIFYRQFKNRNIYFLQRVATGITIINWLFLIRILGNISFPPLLRFFAELVLFFSLFKFNFFFWIGLSLSFFVFTFASLSVFNLFTLGKQNNIKLKRTWLYKEIIFRYVFFILLLSSVLRLFSF